MINHDDIESDDDSDDGHDGDGDCNCDGGGDDADDGDDVVSVLIIQQYRQQSTIEDMCSYATGKTQAKS